MFKKINKIFISVILLLLSGCSINRMMVNTTANFFHDGMDVLYREGDLKLAQQFLGSNLKTIEVMLNRDPDNQKMNLLAAQGFGAYAMAFVQDLEPERAQNLYRRGLNYALKSLPKKKAFSKDIKLDDLDKLLQDYKKGEVPYLFWTAYNWGNIILMELEKPISLMHMVKVEKIMARCEELDEEYNFAGVDLFYGSYYAARPKMLGGDPEKGRDYFQRCFQLNSEKFYLAKYFCAQYYAIGVNDEELFDKLIKEIENLDIDKYPEYRLMNAIAKEKAQRLKENKSKYF
ncbi:MAG: TRAP transporter TatT component family protein [Candidatus Marinimicrobia bacterium]|nr:TRAP transporter TatT component family protein [Candidatus Neomarinimicrobiota bacterium]